jgi:hypothetical protein
MYEEQQPTSDVGVFGLVGERNEREIYHKPWRTSSVFFPKFLAAGNSQTLENFAHPTTAATVRPCITTPPPPHPAPGLAKLTKNIHRFVRAYEELKKRELWWNVYTGSLWALMDREPAA